MKRTIGIFLALLLGAAQTGMAQNLEDLNLEFHGYATQGFLYTTNNNIFTTSSSDGSPAWTEAVINLGATPVPKLRITVQARYELLGNYSNAITLDYAAADYKATDWFGVRFGKVKIPSGLLNEIQDIDPSYLWALLPQSVYPIASRNGQLSEYGGVAYGVLSLEGHPGLGKLDYRGWSGEVSLASDDGYFLPYEEQGITLPQGFTAIESGAAIHWRTPIPGLMAGASYLRTNHENNKANLGSIPGSLTIKPYSTPDYFARYEKDKVMAAVEWDRLPATGSFLFTGLPPIPIHVDNRAIYGMASYKATDKLTVGVYDSQLFDRGAALGPARYSKDWAVSGRYDFNQFLYAKAEQHFLRGTNEDYDAALNPGGLLPTTKLTILKVGVSF